MPRQSSPEAEASLIGAVLVASGDVFDLPAVKSLRPEQFHDRRWREVWGTICRIQAEGGTADYFTVASDLHQRGRLDAVGGAAVLSETMNMCPSALDAGEYATTIVEWHWRRRIHAAISDLGAAVTKGDYTDAARRAAEVCTGALRWREGRVQYVSMGDIRAFHGATAWAWPRWVPVGHLTLIAGPQACGKSYFAARLVASLTGHIARWPDGKAAASDGSYKLPSKVLLVETEEMRGAYADRLSQMGVGDEWVLFGPGDETHIPDLLREAGSVEHLVTSKSLGAVVIDSLSGGHMLREESAEMRKLLRAYARMAGELHVPIIIVHHARKRGPLEPASVTLDRVRGSTTITQFCRSVIALYRQEDGDQNSPVRVQAIKSTFCAPPKPLGFRITDQGLVTEDAPVLPRHQSQWERARKVVLSALEDGPALTTEIERAAKEAGVSGRTLRRVKKALGVRATRQSARKNGETVVRWFWELQGLVADSDIHNHES